MPDSDFLRSLFTADCVLIVERNATVSWCNDLAGDLLGVERGIVTHARTPLDLGLACGDSDQAAFDMAAIPLDRIWEGQPIVDIEVCVKSPRTGNESIWFNVTVEPVFGPTFDQVTAAIVTGHDITSRRLAVRGLEDSNAALTALLQASPLPILAFSPDGNINYWNLAAEGVFGWERAEVIGRPVPFIPAEKRAEHREMRQQDLKGDRLVNREIRRMRKDGEPIDLSVSTAPIRDDSGAVTGTICVYMDISDRKKLEDQLWQSSRMESLGALAGGVAHDFNNLLTSILGNTSLAICDSAPDSDQELALQNVIEACHRAVLLTNQMLAYSGKGRFHLERVYLSELVWSMRALIEATLGAGIAAKFELREGLPPVDCDPRQLQQVVMNVVINAGEAIQGCGEVVLRTDDAEGGVRLEICDTGCGMDADTRARMFDPFFSTKFTGRGLGLAAVIGSCAGTRGRLRWIARWEPEPCSGFFCRRSESRYRRQNKDSLS